MITVRQQSTMTASRSPTQVVLLFLSCFAYTSFAMQIGKALFNPSSGTQQATRSALSLTRRDFFVLPIPAVVAVTTSLIPQSALAIGTDEALSQWNSAVHVIDDDLIGKWPSISAGGGDAIRRNLGTVGTSSPLFQINKAFRVLQDEAKDTAVFVDLTEEFQVALSRADAMAYSANFAGGAGKPTPPAVYIEKSKTEVIELQRLAKLVSAEL